MVETNYISFVIMVALLTIILKLLLRYFENIKK